MKRIFAILIIICAALSSPAQTKTAYFVKNFTLNHELNPAFAPRHGYIGFPCLNNIDIGIYSNLGASSFLFPMENGNVALFLNKDVPSEKFMDKLSDVNYLNGNVKLDIINMGWYAGRGDFWTINIGARTDFAASLPLEFFRFIKEGMKSNPQSYSMENISLGGKAFGEISLGYSSGRLNDLVNGLRIGAKVKFWLGIADVRMNIDRLDMDMGSEAWAVRSISSGHLYAGGMQFTHDEEGYIDGIVSDMSAFGISGFGGGFDLGAEYTISEGTPVDGLRFSFSLTDVGWMRYFKNKSTLLGADGSMKYHGFEGINNPDMDFESEIEKISDDIIKMVSFKDSPAENDIMESFGATLYFGTDYTFFRDKMNIGILYTGKFNKIRDLHELTVAYNYAPADWFDVALSYSMMNTRSAIGFLLTFTSKRSINFFLGSDYINLYYTPQGIPVNQAYVNLNLGISIPFGKNIPKI